MTRNAENLPRRKVTSMGKRGRNFVLRLACGHERLHSPGVPVPTFTHCAVCADPDKGPEPW